jgi:hypothetical protein
MLDYAERLMEWAATDILECENMCAVRAWSTKLKQPNRILESAISPAMSHMDCPTA